MKLKLIYFNISYDTYTHRLIYLDNLTGNKEKITKKTFLMFNE